MKLKWLIIILLCALVLSILLCLKLTQGIQIEELQYQSLKNQMLDLAEDALRYVKLTEGYWKKFPDLGWAFMPTDGKNCAYWRDKQEKLQFFTLLDLALYKNRSNNVYLRPFQYRKGYAFNPVPLVDNDKKLQRVDNIQTAEGRIWIEVQEPGRLIFTGLTKPLKFRQPRKTRLEISNHYLVERTKESSSFYWEPVGKLTIKTDL